LVFRHFLFFRGRPVKKNKLCKAKGMQLFSYHKPVIFVNA
jgi:hypothetical protein